MILLCLTSSTTPRRRNLLIALAQCTVSHFRSSSTKSSSWFLSSLVSACRRSENSFQFHLVICFCITGYLIPACLMVATSYVGCNSTSLAVVLFSLALGASNLNAATYRVNHLDIAPRFSGVLMGITNSAGTIPGIIGPFVVGLLTDNQVCFWRNDYVLCRRRWFQVMDLI